MAESPTDIKQDGFFNFQQVMHEFYKMEGSDLADATKVFMANMVQNAFDSQLAQQMAQYQTSLAQSNMNQR